MNLKVLAWKHFDKNPFKQESLNCPMNVFLSLISSNGRKRWSGYEGRRVLAAQAAICVSAATDNKGSQHGGGVVSSTSVPRERLEPADSLHTAVTWADHSLTNHSIKPDSQSQQSTFASSGGMKENRIIIQMHRRGHTGGDKTNSLRFLWGNFLILQKSNLWQI